MPNVPLRAHYAPLELVPALSSSWTRSLGRQQRAPAVFQPQEPNHFVPQRKKAAPSYHERSVVHDRMSLFSRILINKIMRPQTTPDGLSGNWMVQNQALKLVIFSLGCVLN